MLPGMEHPWDTAQLHRREVIHGAALRKPPSPALAMSQSPFDLSSSFATFHLTACQISTQPGLESVSPPHRLDLRRVSQPKSCTSICPSAGTNHNNSVTYLLPMQLRGPTLNGCRTSRRSSGNAATSMNRSGMNSSGRLKLRGEW